MFVLAPWSSVSAQNFWQPTNGPYGGFINALVINASGHTFAGGTGGIFRSTDNGSSWTNVNNRLSPNALAINASGHIFVGSGSNIFRSTDNGMTWTAINSGLTVSSVAALAFNAGGYIFAGTDKGVFRSVEPTTP